MLRATALLAAGVAALATGGHATTTVQAETRPGIVYTMRMTITAKGIDIPRNRFTVTGLVRYPRGSIIRYAIDNRTTAAVVVSSPAARSDPIQPGRIGSLQVNWRMRGVFAVHAAGTGISLGRAVQVF